MKRRILSAFVLAVLGHGLEALPAQGPPAAAATQSRKTLGLLIFDLTPRGISPSSVTVPEGWYLVRVRNGLTLTQLSVRLDHETAGPVTSNSIKAASSASQSEVQLQAGKHTLTVGTRSGWTAVISVTKSQ